MPYEDNTFDAVLNAVSVDYMTKPLQLFQEIHRVLKPGGTAIMSFSNRCFPTKAIAIWTQTGDPDHVSTSGKIDSLSLSLPLSLSLSLSLFPLEVADSGLASLA